MSGTRKADPRENKQVAEKDALSYDGIAVPSRKSRGFSLRVVVVPSSTNKEGS